MNAWRPTEWSMIVGLGRAEDPATYERAWQYLFDRYRPLFVRYAGWCLRRMGGATLARNDADEVVDAFLADCIEKEWLTRARQARGRFRTFARKVLARYVRDWMERRRAQKRMPAEGPPLQVEDLAAIVGAEEANAIEAEMDRGWSEHLVGLALASTRERSPRNATAIECLSATPDVDKGVLAARLDVRERQVPLILFRARAMFAEELWAQVKETCGSREEYLEERAALRPWLERYLDPETTHSVFDDGSGRGG